MLSVTTVTSENGPKEEEEEEESIDLTEQGNGEGSEAGPDAAVVIPDVHIPNEETPAVVVHTPDEQDIYVSMISVIPSVIYR